MNPSAPKRKFKFAGLIAFVILAIAMFAGLLILPINPGLKTFSYFLYFYICFEIVNQIYISKRKNRERQTQKKDAVGPGPKNPA